MEPENLAADAQKVWRRVSYLFTDSRCPSKAVLHVTKQRSLEVLKMCILCIFCDIHKNTRTWANFCQAIHEILFKKIKAALKLLPYPLEKKDQHYWKTIM